MPLSLKVVGHVQDLNKCISLDLKIDYKELLNVEGI